MGPGFHKSPLIFHHVFWVRVIFNVFVLFWLAILAIVATGERHARSKVLFCKKKQ